MGMDRLAAGWQYAGNGEMMDVKDGRSKRRKDPKPWRDSRFGGVDAGWDLLDLGV